MMDKKVEGLVNEAQDIVYNILCEYTELTSKQCSRLSAKIPAKILSLLDLALIDRNPNPIYPSMVFYCKDCDKMVKNTYCNIVDENWLKVILLTKALKENDG